MTLATPQHPLGASFLPLALALAGEYTGPYFSRLGQILRRWSLEAF